MSLNVLTSCRLINTTEIDTMIGSIETHTINGRKRSNVMTMIAVRPNLGDVGNSDAMMRRPAKSSINGLAHNGMTIKTDASSVTRRQRERAKGAGLMVIADPRRRANLDDNVIRVLCESPIR